MPISSKKILTLLLLFSLLGVGCGTQKQSQSVGHKTPEGVDYAMYRHGNPNQAHSEHTAQTDVHTISSEGKLQILTTKTTSDQVQMHFKLFDSKHTELTPQNLTTVHDKKLHLIIVDERLNNFQHVHPEYKDDQWTTSFSTPHQGNYHMYFDIAPQSEEAQVIHHIFSSSTTSSQPKLAFPSPTPDQTVRTNEIKVHLKSSTGFVSGKATTLTFTLSKNGEPLTTIDPYLGAYGHVVILAHVHPDYYLHVHPLADTPPVNGQVVFHTTFPEPGRYTVFAQFQINGKIHTFPLTIDIAEGTTTEAHPMHHEMHH